MPNYPQKTYKGIIPFVALAFVIALSVFSCKSDKKDTNPSDLFNGPNSINFTIGGDQLSSADQIGKDITMMDYQEDRANTDHVLHIPINDSVYFKDISQFKGDPPGERQWFVDEQPLASNAREVAFYSEEVGPTVVTLKFDDYNHVRKGIYFTDAVSFDQPYAVDDEPLDDEPTGEIAAIDNRNYNSQPEKRAVAKVEPKPRKVKETPTRSSTNSNSSSNVVASKPATRPTPAPKPAPVVREISRVDFSMSKSMVETGEKVTFRDLSEPAVAINQRIWDWGDGTTMPTRGSTAGYSFYKAGTYSVKLCLNYSSKCTTKTITVKQKKADPLPPPPPEKKKEEVKVEPKKVEVSKVVISSATKTQVGKPIQISDNTYPAEAVETREWYVNGTKTNVSKKTFSKAFDKPGVYSIKLCVNGSSLCETTKITIEDKPKPPPPVKKEETTAAVEEEFFPMANSRTGLRSSQRCPEADSKWHDGGAELTITPTVRLELLNARIYGQKVSQAAVVIKSNDGKITRKINNVQILPGPSTIEFGDFGIVLQPGTKYTITIEPMSGETLSLENGGSCNTSFASDDRLGVSYKDKVMTLYDIKFSY